jgi:hypothetical protein
MAEAVGAAASALAMVKVMATTATATPIATARATAATAATAAAPSMVMGQLMLLQMVAPAAAAVQQVKQPTEAPLQGEQLGVQQQHLMAVVQQGHRKRMSALQQGVRCVVARGEGAVGLVEAQAS